MRTGRRCTARRRRSSKNSGSVLSGAFVTSQCFVLGLLDIWQGTRRHGSAGEFRDGTTVHHPRRRVSCMRNPFARLTSSASSASFDLDPMIECDDEYWTHPDPAQAFQQPPGKPSIVTFANTFIRLLKIQAFASRTIVSLLSRELGTCSPTLPSSSRSTSRSS